MVRVTKTPRAPKMSIKAGDTVFVRAGKDREGKLTPEQVERLTPEEQKREANRHEGRQGRVLRVLPEKGRVVVEGVNMITKHARPRGRTPAPVNCRPAARNSPAPSRSRMSCWSVPVAIGPPECAGARSRAGRCGSVTAAASPWTRFDKEFLGHGAPEEN